MSDQTVGEATRTVEAGERVGFCQDCGKPLTRETVRTVGSGVFCEPCLETRLGYSGRPAAGYGAAPGYGAGANYGAPAGPAGGPGYVPPPPPYSAVNVPPVPPPPPGAGAASGSSPSPALAALLGIIPGVGAFYNGQFAKGFAHLIIFVALAALKDVSDVFGILVFAWICYQSIEAYHTAKARRDGLPLPNPFGLNDIGERFGFGKNWGHLHPDPAAAAAAQSAQAASNAAASAAATAADAASVAASSASGAWGAPVNTGVPPAAQYPPASYGAPPANWAGYVSSANFAGNATPPLGTPYAPPPPVAAPVPPTGAGGPWVPGSYESTFTGAGPAYPVAAPLPPAPVSRFPVGAIWLIAIGLLILVGDLSSQWRLSGLWMLTLLLAGMAVWSASRKLGYLGGVDSIRDGNARVLVCMLRGPVMLTTLAVLFGLQAAHVATLGQTWPALLIIFGIMLLLERTIGSGPVIPPYSAPAGAYVPYAATVTAAAPAPPAPETSASFDGTSQSGGDGTQGGQR